MLIIFDLPICHNPRFLCHNQVRGSLVDQDEGPFQLKEKSLKSSSVYNEYVRSVLGKNCF